MGFVTLSAYWYPDFDGLSGGRSLKVLHGAFASTLSKDVSSIETGCSPETDNARREVRRGDSYHVKGYLPVCIGPRCEWIHAVEMLLSNAAVQL